MQIIFLSGTKYLWLPQYVNIFFALAQKFGPAQNILGPGQGIRKLKIYCWADLKDPLKSTELATVRKTCFKSAPTNRIFSSLDGATSNNRFYEKVSEFIIELIKSSWWMSGRYEVGYWSKQYVPVLFSMYLWKNFVYEYDLWYDIKCFWGTRFSTPDLYFFYAFLQWYTQLPLKYHKECFYITIFQRHDTLFWFAYLLTDNLLMKKIMLMNNLSQFLTFERPLIFLNTSKKKNLIKSDFN